MTETHLPAKLAHFVQSQVSEMEQRHQEELANLREQLDVVREQFRMIEANHQMDRIDMERTHRAHLVEVLGDNMELDMRCEAMRAERDAAVQENERLAPENAELRARHEREAEERACLAAKNTDLDTQLKAVLWDLSQLQVDREEDKCLVPERKICPRCKGNDTQYRKNDGYYCDDCEEVYEPYPSKDV